MVDLPQLGGSFYEQAFRPNDVPSMHIACPTVPHEVLQELSSRSGNLEIANFQAVERARTECDKSFFCDCLRCTSGRNGFLQALRSKPAPSCPPPRFRNRISQSIPEDRSIAIVDQDISPSSKIGTLSLLPASRKAPPPPCPSLAGAFSSRDNLDEASSYTATHVSMDSVSERGGEIFDDDWRHASRATASDPLIMGVDTEHFEIGSRASVDSFASWYKDYRV